MSTTNSHRVVWLFDGNHLFHPFIRQGADSLVDAGLAVTVIDYAWSTEPTRYLHYGGGGRLLVTAQSTSNKHLNEQNDNRQSGSNGGNAHSTPTSVRSSLQRLISENIKPQLSRWRFLWYSLRQTLKLKPTIIVTTLPTMGLLGWIAARILRARLVYYPFELYGEQHTRPSHFLLTAERLLLAHGIDALITQNRERARVYREERDARVIPTVVHNYKAKRELSRTPCLRESLNLPREIKIVLYEGLLVQGRWLDRLLCAAAGLPVDARLVIIGRKAGPYCDRVIVPLLHRPEISGKVMLLPEVPHSEILSYVSDADVGIIIYDDTVRNNLYCEPGKLSDYVFAGIPVVAPAFPTIASVIKDYSIGEIFKCSEPREIARAINLVLSTPKQNWKDSLTKAAAALTWETQEHVFLSAVLG